MKTVFTSQEIAHVWAHKSAPHGKSPGAVSFDGNVIYSYRTAMARHIEHKGSLAIILNVTGYSVSTSKHQGRINRALHGLDIPIFRVDSQGMGASLRFTGDELFTHFVENAARCIEQSKLPRIRPHTVEAHKGRAAHYLEQAKAVATFYGLRKKVDEKAIERLAGAKLRAEKRERIAQEKRDQAERERQQAAFAAWIASEPMPEGVYLNARIFPVAFRLEGEELVSTLGARVPLQAARVAYRFITSKRGQAWRENGETCQVGNYRLNAINEQGIVAGCHRIAWAEIERLASILA
jgi:hypothetical protein